MLFNSYEYLFFLLPLTIILYYWSGKYEKYTLGKIILILSSTIMLGYVGINHVVWLIISVLVNYFLNCSISRIQQKKLVFLKLGVSFNIIFLIFFKYVNFIPAFSKIVMPIGISFYTFQQIAYLVDNYREDCHKKYSFTDYFLFITYFPKILQGPIVYHTEIIQQINDAQKKKLNMSNLSGGLFIFAIGLAKKVLVADVLGSIVDYGYNNISNLNVFEVVLVIIGYTLQLYFDFSGYCDMAKGTSRMLNIDLADNFNSPYKAMNISDFWKRWHITLTRFLTKYIYIPLGGNRQSIAKTYINIMVVYIISGVWHGAGLCFLVWGIMHGLLTILYRILKTDYDRIPKILQWLINFFCINIAWVFFRAPSINSGIHLFRQLFVGDKIFAINAELTESLLQPIILNVICQFVPIAFAVLGLYILLMIVILFGKNSNELLNSFTPKWSNLIMIYVLLMLSICSISGVTSFLYVNF